MTLMRVYMAGGTVWRSAMLTESKYRFNWVRMHIWFECILVIQKCITSGFVEHLPVMLCYIRGKYKTINKSPSANFEAKVFFLQTSSYCESPVPGLYVNLDVQKGQENWECVVSFIEKYLLPPFHLAFSIFIESNKQHYFLTRFLSLPCWSHSFLFLLLNLGMSIVGH